MNQNAKKTIVGLFSAGLVFAIASLMMSILKHFHGPFYILAMTMIGIGSLGLLGFSAIVLLGLISKNVAGSFRKMPNGRLQVSVGECLFDLDASPEAEIRWTQKDLGHDSVHFIVTTVEIKRPPLPPIKLAIPEWIMEEQRKVLLEWGREMNVKVFFDIIPENNT